MYFGYKEKDADQIGKFPIENVISLGVNVLSSPSRSSVISPSISNKTTPLHSPDVRMRSKSEFLSPNIRLSNHKVHPEISLKIPTATSSRFSVVKKQNRLKLNQLTAMTVQNKDEAQRLAEAMRGSKRDSKQSILEFSSEESDSSGSSFSTPDITMQKREKKFTGLKKNYSPKFRKRLLEQTRQDSLKSFQKMNTFLTNLLFPL